MAALESALAKRAEPEVAPPPPDVPSAVEMEQLHDARLAQHAQQVVDRRWASVSADALRRDFEQDKGDAAFTVSEIDCRTSSCAVKLSWPSRELALSGWQQALHKVTRLPCAREIVIPDEAGKQGGSAEASLLLDCSTWVAAGSPPRPEMVGLAR